jgi:VCBS repeat-containing protein
MISTVLPKSRSIPFLVTLFMTIQLAACGAEELFSAVAPEFDPGADVVIENTAKISGTNTGSIIEDVDPDDDNLLEVGGKLDITDSDAGEAAFVAKKIYGDYGDLDIESDGTWNYAADNSQSVIQDLAANATLTDTLIVSSIDGTTSTIDITIIGVIDSETNTNNSAVITGSDSSSITEDNDPDNDNLLETGGKLNITDIDPGEAVFIATTFNGNYGGLTIDTAGNWRYAASNDQTVIQNLSASSSLSDSLTVSSLDGSTHTVVITVLGVDEPNNPAVITGVDNGSVTEDVDPDSDNLLEVSGKLDISDSNAGEAAFIAATASGNYGSLTINAAGNWNYAAVNDQTVIQNLDTGASLSDKLTVSSLDGTTHTVTIAISGADETSTTANIDLSWVAPVEREDNEPISLSEIAGYKIYYGTTQGQYPNNVTINDGSAVDYTFQTFTAGTYYFVVTTIDTEGRESGFSTEVVFTI